MTYEPQQYEELIEEPAAPRPDPLSFIRPRARRSLDIVQHSFMVRRFRSIVPVVALLILLALIVWPMLSPNKIAAIAMKNIPDLVIKNLHFTGLSTKNEPYSLTADKATRPAALHNIYDFDNPQGEITLLNGTWVAGKAQYGRFNQDTRRLWLGGNVQLFQDKGYQFTTDEAQVDLNENNAWGEKPVLIQGDFGEIRGQGFRLFNSGKVIVINGPATASLHLRTSGSSDKPAKASP